nr:hypothetical protein [Tanacetum cinerariifolium]
MSRVLVEVNEDANFAGLFCGGFWLGSRVVEIDVEVVLVRIDVDSIVHVPYLARYIGYQTRDIVRTRLNVEMKMLHDLKKMTSLILEASRGSN